MYKKAVSLYFIPPYEQSPTFFSEYQQDFSLTFVVAKITFKVDVITSPVAKITSEQ